MGRTQVMLNVAGVQQFVRFERTNFKGNGPLDNDTSSDGYGDPTDIQFDPITNKAPAYMIPHFGMSSSFGLPNTVFAFGFYPPYAPDLSYKAVGAQRYSLIDTQVIQTALGPSVAHKFFDWVSLGAGISWNWLYAEQELAISLPFHQQKALEYALGNDLSLDGWNPDPNEDPANDVRFKFEAQDASGIGWNLGVLLEPPSHAWAFGLMIQPPVSFHTEGKMSADFSNHVLYKKGAFDDDVILSKKVMDNKVKMEIAMPLIIKSGFAVRPGKQWELELASVWQNWSSIEQITITDLNLVVDLNEDFEVAGQPMGLEDAVIDENVNLPAAYQDSFSLRFGGQKDFGKTWSVRAGTFYESSGVPPATQSVALVDGPKFGYGMGGTYQPHWRIAIDLGISQSFLKSREVTDSEVRQISVHPMTGKFLDGSTIGNGKYSSSLLIFGMGLNFYFQKALKSDSAETTG